MLTPAATAAAAPPLDPPDVNSKFHGFRQWSFILLSFDPLCPNSGQLVLPRMIPSSFLILSTII